MSGKWFAVLVLLIAGLVISACNSHTERPPDPQSLIQAGMPLYQNNCASCHQPDGQGQSGKYPKLAGNPMVTLEDPAPIITIVVYGKGAMPGFNEKLNPDQIAEVLSYIRNAWGNQSPAVDSRQIP